MNVNFPPDLVVNQDQEKECFDKLTMTEKVKFHGPMCNKNYLFS